MIFKSPHLLTKLEVWFPKYSTQYTEKAERVALLHKDKVDHATPWIIVEFTKAKHLHGQRFCIKRESAQTYPITNNGSAKMYEVPMSKLEYWDTVDEVKAVVNKLWKD